jgi:hypothetical protein
MRKLDETFRGAFWCITTTADACREAGVTANNTTTATIANDVESYQSYNTITNDRTLCIGNWKFLRM